MKPTKQFLPVIRPRAHSVSLLEYRDGRFLATWFTGTREGNEDQVAVASMLDSSTGKWAEPFVTLRQFPYDDDYWVPEQTCPIETGDGATVVYTWAAPLSGFKLVERRPGAVAGDAGMTSASASLTYGKVWSRGIENCRPFRFRLENNKAVGIECLSGRDGLPEQGIVFQGQPVLRDATAGPAAGWIVPYHTERQPDWFYSRFHIVEGDGTTAVRNEVDLHEPPGCLEPALAQLPDGRWMCYMRNGEVGGFVWRSESADGGRTFTNPVATNLRNPHSAVDIAVGQSGRLLVLYNDSHRLRTPLTLGISEDEGATFRTRDIEDGIGEFSYPKLYQTKDGVWRAMYTYQRDCIAEVRFDEDWLLGGRKVLGL
jgi:hypothetical protein